MKARYAIIMAVIAAVILFPDGCSEDDAQEASAPAAPAPAPAPEPAPKPEPVSEPYAYGDDPALDALYDKCADGNIDACDELYWKSPVGSRYEEFGLDRTIELEESEVAVDVPDDIDPALVLDIAWETSLTAAERQDICDGVDVLGYDTSGRLLAESSGGTVTASQAAAWLRTKC